MRFPTTRLQRRNEPWTKRERWKREREMASALARHGIGLTLVQAKLGWVLPFQWGLLKHPRRDEPYSGPEHLRMAFEDLGPTFIKLAQILSTRGDLIGPEYAAELARLQSNVPPLPFSEMTEVLDAELPVPRDEIFATFDTEPIGSASIGQVYRATLHTGETVVVKIQRPGIRRVIELDLEILRRGVARILSSDTEESFYDIAGFLDEFAFTLNNELDYTYEGENAERFRSIHHDDPDVFIPEIYWEHSTSRVLVMDEVRGTEFAGAPTDESLTLEDRDHLASVALRIAFTQIFREGFFHADPHPGNLIIMEDRRIGLIDFGIVGTLTEHQRDHFLDFAYTMSRGDSEGMIDALWGLGVTEPEAQRRSVARDFDHLFHRVGHKSFADLAAADMVGELMRIAHRHQLQFPPDLALMFKVLAMLESTATLVDAKFLFFDALEPQIEVLLRERTSPSSLGKRAGHEALDMARLLEGLPHRADRLLQRLETGDLEFSVRQNRLEAETKRLHRALDRLTIGLTVVLFLLAGGVYVIAAELAATTSARLGYLQIVFVIGVVVLATLGVGAWRARRR